MIGAGSYSGGEGHHVGSHGNGRTSAIAGSAGYGSLRRAPGYSRVGVAGSLNTSSHIWNLEHQTRHQEWADEEATFIVSDISAATTPGNSLAVTICSGSHLSCIYL
jgi:hypothetical protein